MRVYYKKGGCYGKQACIIDIGKTEHHENIFSRQVDLAYDIAITRNSTESLLLQCIAIYTNLSWSILYISCPTLKLYVLSMSSLLEL